MQKIEAKQRRILLEERGLEIALLDWGGDGPLVLMHHANGFCAGTLGLVAEALVPAFRVIAMDARGHGDSSRPEGPNAYEWDHFALDYLAVAERLAAEHASGRVGVGVGHSFGGTSALGAAARRPDLFERLVLVDPVIPPPAELVRSLDPERAKRLVRLVEGARRRRSVWPSRAAARAHFAAKSLFRDWLPGAIDLYVDHGLRARVDGQVELKCPGEVEAAIFGSSSSVDVADLARRAASVPTTVLWAERGDFPRDVYGRVFGSLPKFRILDVPCGHLVPMERPDLVVAAIRGEGEASAWRSSTT
ncbi:MAG: alpha/beta hydrolase [Myxococcota bacterium]|jgi:pimeloyl-ACP methyl ester carboxylesterase|nr:alpha/beta hydrolase [Myxococcota bacterium]